MNCYSSNKCRMCFGKHNSLVHVKTDSCQMQQVESIGVVNTSSDSDPEFVEYVNMELIHTKVGTTQRGTPPQVGNTQGGTPPQVGSNQGGTPPQVGNTPGGTPPQIGSTQGGTPPFSVDTFRQRTTALAFSVIAVKNPVTNKVVLVNALLDTGANSTSISKKLGQLLLLDGKKEHYTVEVSGGDIKKYITKVCHIKIGERKGKHWRDVAARILPHPCGSLRSPDWNDNKHWFPHLKDVPLPSPVNRGIVDVILGTDCADLMRALKPDTYKENWMPILRHTLLGPVPIGTIELSRRDRPGFSSLQNATWMEVLRSEDQVDDSNVFMDGNDIAEQKENKFDVVRREMHYLFDIPSIAQFTRECQRINVFQKELVIKFYKLMKIKENRAYAGLLWKDDTRPFSNHFAALQLFKRTENFCRPPKIRHQIQKTISDWVQQGFLKEITEFRDRHRDDCFYIPSFIITREDRSTTKHHLVFNAARAFSGKSLNDYLSPGPNNMCDLTQVLLRFRRHPFTYTCDIKQMYMQIKVHPKDRPYLRFFS